MFSNIIRPSFFFIPFCFMLKLIGLLYNSLHSFATVYRFMEIVSVCGLCCIFLSGLFFLSTYQHFCICLFFFSTWCADYSKHLGIIIFIIMKVYNINKWIGDNHVCFGILFWTKNILQWRILFFRLDGALYKKVPDSVMLSGWFTYYFIADPRAIKYWIELFHLSLWKSVTLSSKMKCCHRACMVCVWLKQPTKRQEQVSRSLSHRLCNLL